MPQGTLLTEQQLQNAVNQLLTLIRNNNVPIRSAIIVLQRALTEIQNIANTTILE